MIIFYKLLFGRYQFLQQAYNLVRIYINENQEFPCTKERLVTLRDTPSHTKPNVQIGE